MFAYNNIIKIIYLLSTFQNSLYSKLPALDRNKSTFIHLT